MKSLISTIILAAAHASSQRCANIVGEADKTICEVRTYLEYARIVMSCDPPSYDFASNEFTGNFTLKTMIESSGLVGYSDADKAIWIAFSPAPGPSE